jgi:hypothetical protein
MQLRQLPLALTLTLMLALPLAPRQVLATPAEQAEDSEAQVLARSVEAVSEASADEVLLEETARHAWLFFRDRSDSRTGLAVDRARNAGADTYHVASLASTGYALAALTIAAERGWATRAECAQQAQRTLDFVLSMPHQRGWLFHFVDARDGTRAWKSEVSTIDTALFTLGALAAGEYFKRDFPLVARRANEFYARLDWNWARTNGGKKPDKQVLAHGWTPEKGFLRYDYGAYSEAILLVLLGLGAPKDPLPPECWDAIARPTQEFEGIPSLQGGPIFIHQMPHGWLPLQNKRDRLGWDYWVSSSNAVRQQQLFAARNTKKRKTFARGFWALNAGDGPRGYKAYGAPNGPEDGTVSPTGMLAAITFDEAAATEAARRMFDEEGPHLWGAYGFSNGFNVDKKWFAPDVIGIDLGMALLALENHRSGLLWKLTKKQTWVARAFKKAGLRETKEVAPRRLQK